jgi:hypothetical protein
VLVPFFDDVGRSLGHGRQPSHARCTRAWRRKLQ